MVISTSVADRRTRPSVSIHSGLFPMKVALLLLSPFVAVFADDQPRASDVRREMPKVGSVFRDDEDYTLTVGDVRAILGFRRDMQRLRFELSLGGHVEASASMAAARKMEFLRPLLERFFSDQGYGRHYTFAMNFYTELGARIADSAVHSKEWDRRTGRSIKAGDDFILKLLKQTTAPYIELSSTMQSFHYQLTIESIENRIVLPFRDFNSYEKKLMATRPDPNEKLPCGASIYFVLTKEK